MAIDLKKKFNFYSVNNVLNMRSDQRLNYEAKEIVRAKASKIEREILSKKYQKQAYG